MIPAERLILLVEDDPADARLIQRAFEKAELRARITRLPNGDDAVAYLSGHKPFDNRSSYPLPAVILLDIKLPRRSGFEVLSWLRSRKDGLQRIPVVMLTSSRHCVDVNRAYDLGANSYLTKPDTNEHLAKMVATFDQYWMSYNEHPSLGVS
jgi:CheY-like chemotaxis protein